MVYRREGDGMVEVELPLIISSIISTSALGVSLLSFLHTKSKDYNAECREIYDRISELDKYSHTEIGKLNERVKSVERFVDSWWSMMEKEMATVLKHPTKQELDDLLDKFVSHSITTNELLQLKHIIQLELDNSRALKDYGKTIALTFLNVSIDRRLNCNK